MPPTLQAVAGASDANSYATIDEAAAFFEERPAAASAWASATEQDQAAALIQATQELEQRFTWRGGAASTTQGLAFPRTGLTRDGVEVADNSIPDELVRAVSLWADFILSGGETPGGVLAVGPIRGMRTQAEDALPGRVLVALPGAWVRDHIGSTVGAVSVDG